MLAGSVGTGKEMGAIAGLTADAAVGRAVFGDGGEWIATLFLGMGLAGVIWVWTWEWDGGWRELGPRLAAFAVHGVDGEYGRL